jgi:hypothetical protein
MNIHKSIVLFLLLSNAMAFGYEGPSPLMNVKIDALTSFDSSKGIYKYAYKVTNPSTNDGDIVSLNIFISYDPLRELKLQDQGLTHCKYFGKSSLTTILQSKPIIPVGSTAPDSWRCSYAVLADYKDGSYMWSARKQNKVSPGASLEGISLVSYGLPGIRDVLVKPDIDLERLPPEYYENVDKTVALENKVKWMGKTVGPKAPPKVFVGSDSLANLIVLANQSRSNGWIDNDGILNSLLAKLNDAAKKLASSDVKTAKNVLSAFLQDVQAQNGKHLTAEAYSLLYYNGKYLVDRL